MLTLSQIEKHVQQRRYEPLVEAVTANGLPLPAGLRLRLAQSPAAAVGLGLRRLVELTYGPTPASRALSQWLVEQQGPDGSFDADPLATAVAAAALGAVVREQPTLGDPAIGFAHERATAALAALQRDDGLFASPADRDHDQRAAVSVFILLLLQDDDLFIQAIRLGDLLDRLDDSAERFDEPTHDLHRLARGGGVTPTRPHRSPALTAIAA